jgi:hypothetical protein
VFENKVLMTVIFPDGSLPESINGGFGNQTTFAEAVKHRDLSQYQAELHSRPTKLYLEDYKGLNIIRAFPLQFPFGHSGLPEDTGTRTYINTLKHFLRLSLPAMHHGDFILVIHNIYARSIAFRSAMLRCQDTYKDATYGEAFANITPDGISRGVTQIRSGQRGGAPQGGRVVSRFFNSLEAACASMAHTNGASRVARQNMFSLAIKFGLPAVFFTVTPDDEMSFRIRVHATHKWVRLLRKDNLSQLYNLPTICASLFCWNLPHSQEKLPNLDMDDTEILADFKLRANFRVVHPGLCAEEYGKILHLVIKHLVGWDTEAGKSSVGGGIFGETEAFAAATEEQSRKTLHMHILVWIKNWNGLLMTILRGHVGNQRHRQKYDASVALMLNFVKNAACSTIHQDNNHNVLNADQFAHDCDTRPNKRRCMEGVQEQILRKMRHKTGHKDCDGCIARCQKCKKGLTSEGLILNVLNITSRRTFTKFPDRKTHTLSPIISRLLMDFDWVSMDAPSQARRLFYFNASYNLHRTAHAVRCFKRDKECFAHLPKPLVEKTAIEQEKKAVDWFSSFGKREECFLFRVEHKRSIADAFVNTHNPMTTKILGCNNNVSCALSGRSVIYATAYTGKNTQKDDRYAYEKVCEAMVKQLRAQERRELAEPDQSLHLDRDFRMGLRRLLSGIMAHTHAHIVSAPMARHIIMNKERFEYSHEFIKIPLDGIKALMFDRKVRFFMRKFKGRDIPFTYALNYVKRPDAMEDMSVYDFYSKTSVTTIKRAEDEDIEHFPFKEDHPMHAQDVVVYRDKDCVPSFCFEFLPDASGLGGAIARRTRNKTIIFSSRPQHLTVEQSEYREKFALHFLILFYPARQSADLYKNSSAMEKLEEAMSLGKISDGAIEIADNIQNIHNSLNAGVPEEGLDSRTTHFDG